MSDQSTLRTIEKLGHGLAEVRHRALASIRAKLEHQLVTIKQLNETPDFARRLMEWFNYPTPGEVDYVLTLVIESIVICGETFVQLGALQFFPALRDDLEEHNRNMCDQILTTLEQYKHADFELSTISASSQQSNHISTKSETTFDFGDLAKKVAEQTAEAHPRSAYFLGVDRPQKKNNYPEWFTFVTFPWETLTLTDRQVLQQTNSSLCSRNVQTVSDYTLFLGDVIFADFPAEVFIQRPHILQSFMGFIATCADGEHLGTALKTLAMYGSKLSDRLVEAKRRDTKTTLAPGYPAGYEVGGTDCWEHEPVELLRQHEVALPIITVELIETLASLLKKAQLENVALIRDCIIKLTAIFAKCVDWAKFTETDDLSAYVLGKLRSTLDWMSGAVLQAAGVMTGVEVIQMSETLHFNVLVGLLEKTLKLLSPLSIVRQIAPMSLERALQLVIFDSSIPGRSLQVDSILVKYATHLDPVNGAALTLLRKHSASLADARRVLSGSSSELTHLRSGMDTIAIHMSQSLITRIVDYVAVNGQHQLLLDLMGHAMQTVRQMTFVALRQFLDTIIDRVSKSGDISHSDHCAFLVTRSVLEFILCHAVHDASASVVANASKICHILMTSGILWSQSMQNQLEHVLYDNLAHVELLMMVGGDARMTTTILEFIFAESRLTHERLKSILRMLLQKKRETRSDVMAHARALLLELFDRPMGEIVDLFIVANPIDCTEQRLVDKVFRVDSVERLSKLIKSDNIDDSLKYSVYSQLSVITVDGELAQLLLQDIGEQMLYKQLEIFAGRSGLMPEEKEAAGSVCDIIRHCCQVNKKLRGELVNNTDQLINLVKLVELTALSPPQHRRIVSLLYFLVFYEWLNVDKDGIIHTSTSLINALQLPFTCEPLEEKSLLSETYRRENDIIAQHIVAQRTLRLAWNQQGAECDKMALTASDGAYHAAMNLPNVWAELERRARSASCHGDMELVLSRMTLLASVFGETFAACFTADSSLIHGLGRFLQTKPNQLRDEQLLLLVLEFSFQMVHISPRHSFTSFIHDQLSDVNCPLYDYISYQSQATREEAINRRQLITWFTRIIIKSSDAKLHGMILGAIVKRITGKNRRQPSGHFYDLPLIQLITKGLSKLLVSGPKSTRPVEIIANWFHLLPELVEIILSFHHGAGESTQSYMGKSVIRNAIISILNLITHIEQEQWIPVIDKHDQLAWLLSLLNFRCVKIRAAGYGLLSTILQQAAGVEVVLSALGEHIYTRLLRIVLDEREASLVRSLAMDCITKIMISSKHQAQLTKPLHLIEQLELVRFHEQMYHTLRNFSHDGSVESDPDLAPVTPILVKSFNQFILSLLQYSQQDTTINLTCFNFPLILTQIINPRLIGKMQHNKRFTVQQAATTAQILTFVKQTPDEPPMDAVHFVLAFYALEPDHSRDMDVMFQMGNELLALVLEQTHEQQGKQRLVEAINHHLDAFTERALEYLACFWEKTDTAISFVNTLIQVYVKFHQIKSADQIKIRYDPEQERILTLALITRFDELHTKPETADVMKWRALIGCCLQNLFIFDHSICAGEVAIENGFLDRLTTDLARVQIRVTLEKFRQLAETSYGQFIALAFNIIRNVTYRNERGQNHMARGEFPAIASRLWSHCLGSDKLMRPLLQMLLNLTSDNEFAASRVAGSNLISQVTKQFNQFNNQIKIKIKINSLFSLVFRLLDNLSVSSEARVIFWKANLLGGFTKACDCGLHTNRSKQQALALRFWLHLVEMVSYHRDGQEQILAIKDILDYLCDLFQHSNDDVLTVLTIQHNLCFHAPTRIRLSQHNRTLECLSSALTPDEPIKHQQLAASACWALMSSSAKARGRIKARGFVEKLRIARTLLQEEPGNIPLEHFEAAYELINS